MPLYDYECDRGHVTESRQGMDIEFIPCRCGLPAERVQVYRNQFIHAETGPKGGLKNPVPVNEMRLGRDVSEFEEASGEVAYAYAKEERDPPNLYAKAMDRVKKINPKVKA